MYQMGFLIFFFFTAYRNLFVVVEITGKRKMMSCTSWFLEFREIQLECSNLSTQCSVCILKSWVS